ncbi:protein phosphatase regulator [Umbelopsis sp. WA50703]
MADHDQLIAQLMSMADISKDKAQFYLEMAQWDLNAAASQYFETGGEEDPAVDAPVSSDPLASRSAGVTTGQITSSSSQAKSKRVATLRDFSSDDAEKDDEPQSFFAGGEKSGMLVEAPRKDGQDKRNLVEDILKKAAESGAPAPEEEEPERPTYFGGSGYKLGSEEEPSVQVTAESGSSDEPTSGVPVTRQLTFWRNGFSIGDGPLLRYDDPANEFALNAINSGRAPLSLLDVRPGQAVDVRVAKRLDEDYTPPPKAPPKPFEGAGHRLGSPSPEVRSSSSSPAPQVQAPRASQLNVDTTQPVTSIQIRLSDGTRLVSKFNHTHTIADVRGFINASRPGEANRSYVLRSSFPPKPLSDETLTLADAGLLNSVIVQTNQ